MARPTQASGSTEVQRLRKALAREKARRMALEQSLAEAREQSTATADILTLIRRSPTDLRPVFEAIARHALALCGGMHANVFGFDGELMHFIASENTFAEQVDMMRAEFPRIPDASTAAGRAIVTKAIVRIEDALEDRRYDRRMAIAGGLRRVLAVPMLGENAALGAIAVAWRDAGPVPAVQEALLKTFADQAVIAIENARLFNETKEALERQTATAEILKVIASSPSDVQPVFDTVAHKAVDLCGGTFGVVTRYDGELIHVASISGTASFTAADSIRAAFPAKPSRRGAASRSILTRQLVHMPDVRADPEYIPGGVASASGIQSILAVPLMRSGIPLGSVSVARAQRAPFSEQQITLLKTFADQAVIAIENVRLFNETKEALERQTATAEILSVIAGSPSDVQPVFDAIVRAAKRLIGAFSATVTRVAEGKLHLVAHTATTPQGAEALGRFFPIPVEGTPMGRAVQSRQPGFIDDFEADTDAARDGRELARSRGFRSVVFVPLLREGIAIGSLNVTRREPGRLSDHHVELLKTFADQAVIAIENARLFNETKEALERQTAAAEILKVIGSSPTDTQPVFDAIVQAGLKLFAGATVGVARPVGDRVYMEAIAHADPDVAAATKQRFPIPLARDYLHGTAILDARLIDLHDAEVERDGPFAAGVANFIATGNRAMTVMPMVHGGKAIGAISVTRTAPGPLTDKQLALLRIFADQAVIAIENVRLFNETKDALERQTATAEILRVISSSPGNLQPVFDAILENALRLCDAHMGVLSLYEGKLWQTVAQRGATAEFAEWLAQRGAFEPPAFSVLGRMILGRCAVSEADLKASRGYQERLLLSLKAVDAGGMRSIAAVPMLKDGRVIGGIVIYRREVRPFAEKQIDLVTTFANQAVIAIENVRLFKELETRTEALTRSVSQLTALGEVGQAISATLDLEKVLSKVAAHALQLTGLDVATIYEFDEPTGQFELRAWQNMPEDLIALFRQMPIRLGEGVVGQAAALREPVQLPDIQDRSYQTRYRDLLIRQGYRAILAVPMLREDRIIGAITVSRSKPGDFPVEVVELLKTFATQSAMAIQNARLFREIDEKGRQLEQASKHKSQFLASMSHELRTPLNAILGFNEMLLGEVYGPLPEDTKPPLAQMQTSGKHLLRLINNVLDLAKIEAGRMELALSDYSVHDTVESVRATLRPLAEAKGLDFVVEMPADLPLAHGDPGRITQCLMNLAGNSVKFTKQGKVSIHVDQRDGLLVYRVADTGIGIPADKIGNLFTEFRQTDATIASEFGGTGLGLSISRKFIEMHGGRIWAESEPGQGSTFIFEIPLRAGEGKAA